MPTLAKLPRIILILAMMYGGLAGWLQYVEARKDFDRAAAKYRAVKAAYFAVGETLRAVGVPIDDEPCTIDHTILTYHHSTSQE